MKQFTFPGNADINTTVPFTITVEAKDLDAAKALLKGGPGTRAAKTRQLRA